LVLAAVSLTACMAPVGTSGVVSVPPDAAQTCTQHCQAIGMRLTAVAIMANNVGCVCQYPATAGSGAGSSSRAAPGQPGDRRSFGVIEGATESATTTAGMATILMEQERQREQVPPPLTRY
jgi:hypothetical protein